jgi:hypothetical protein
MKSRVHGQRTLFGPLPEDQSADAALARLDLTWRDVIAWRELCFISFDPEAVDSFEPWMLRELAFIRDIARTECSINTVHRLLRELPRPYSYSHAKMSWDFQLGRWRRTYGAGELIDAIAENPDKTAGTVRRLVRVLAWTGQREELENIRGLVDELLDEDLW